jgi:hypothetical protein
VRLVNFASRAWYEILLLVLIGTSMQKMLQEENIENGALDV